MRRSARSRIFLRSSADDASARRCACRRFHTETFASGSSTSRATSLTSCSSVCEPLHAEEAAAVAVGVDVGDRVLPQLLRVRLGPLGRAEQHRLLAVPRAVDDRALRAPALLAQLAERPRLLEQRHEAGDRVLGAVHPRVVVVAAHDPLVRELRAGDARDHVVHGLDVPVERDLQVHLRRARPDVVRDRQRAAPVLGRERAARAPRAAAARRRTRSAARGSSSGSARPSRRAASRPSSRRRPASAGRPGSTTGCPSRCRAARRPSGASGPSGRRRRRSSRRRAGPSR